MKKYKAAAWQQDMDSIKTSEVQLWSKTGIMMQVIPRKQARELVLNDRAFVISDQAVGFYED